MTKRKWIKGILICLVVVLALTGTICGITNVVAQRKIAACKAESITLIDQRLEEIRATAPEYDLLLIEHEAERAKEVIGKLENVQEIQQIAEAAVSTIDSLVLSGEEMNLIKASFCNYLGDDSASEESVLHQRILYYLGAFGECQIVVMRGDYPMILLPSEEFYLAGTHTFAYLPEVVSVYKDNAYYSLNEMYLDGSLSDEDFALILERFEIINQIV